MEKYEKTRKEFYEDEIRGWSAEIAQFLDDGFICEISQSRNGLKVATIARRMQSLKHTQNEGR